VKLYQVAVAWLICCVVGAFGDETTGPDLREIQVLVQEATKKVKGAVVAVLSEDGLGSGVIVDESGLILTAAHVIGPPGTEHEVVFADGSTCPAVALGRNDKSDAGLLQLTDPKGNKTPDPLTVAPMRPLHERPSLGEWCFALGNPGTFDKDRGPVLRVGRVIRLAVDTLQTDCVLMGGDSGGPLFDMKGRVMGIHSRISDTSEQNFHTPIASFHRDWKRMQAKQSLNESTGAPKVGVSTQLNGEFLVVRAIASGSSAAEVGMQVNDRILKIDDEAVTSYAQFTEILRHRLPGEAMVWTMERDGESMTFTVKGRDR
jgi:serine protease Do